MIKILKRLKYLSTCKSFKIENSTSVELLLFFFRVTQIKTYSWDNAQVILVGNKCDMEDERVISFERGKQLAEQLGVEFFETSAKENINVKVHFYLNFYYYCKFFPLFSCLYSLIK